MLVFAHRGYHEQVPENTIEAFAAAAAMGVDGIETDVRLSADGVAVLYHDRLAPDGRAVADVTAAELAALAGHPIPRLVEALDALPDMLWMLEVKSPQAEQATLNAVRSFGSARRIWITSFWHDLARRLSAALGVPGGLLVAHRPEDMSWAHPTGLVDRIVWYYGCLDRAILDEAAVEGWRNIVWGLAAPADHEQCLAWPIEGVITDRPE